MKNTFGSDLSLTIFGESHGRAIGAVLDGMAAGVPVEEAFLAACMDKRRARGDGLSTPRVEGDAVQFLSGVVNGRTTGTAIALMIENQNTRSGDYAKTADLLRPGHADYTAYAKYHGYQDARGGGHFSGRVTAALVAGGALVLGALNRAGIEIVTHIGRCAGIGDAPFALDDPAALAAQAEALLNKSEGFALLDGSVEEPMKAAIRAAGAEGDSVGGVLETAILGLPAGVGEPYFDSVESKLAHLAFSIPAVKGIEFGSGFGFADQKGSEANDAFRMQGERIVAATNKNLERAIARGEFRSDLYYRLKVAVIAIPPLRDRQADILPLARMFLRFYGSKYHRQLTFSEEAESLLLDYKWPGNIRELENLVQGLAVTSKDSVIRASDVPISGVAKPAASARRDGLDFELDGKTYKEIMKDLENKVLSAAMERYGSITEVARHFQVDRSTIFRKVKELEKEGKMR